MKVWNAIAGGLAGACAITVLHQVVKNKKADAPRMDLLGMESLTKILQYFDAEIPRSKKLYYATMAGDIFSNAIFYSLAGFGKKTLLKGSALGLTAGLGAVFLPKPMGLNEQQSNRTKETQALAVAYYLAGGVLSSSLILLLNHLTADKTKTLVQKVKGSL